MTFDNVIELVNIEKIKNEYGEIKDIKTFRKVYCSIKSIRKQEQYQAMALGYDPKYIFVLTEPLEYCEEERIMFDNVEYRIIAKYEDKAFGTIELTCSKVILEE